MERSDVVISLKRLVRVVHANWGPTLREAIALLSTPEPFAAAQGPSREQLLKLTKDFLADKPDASAKAGRKDMTYTTREVRDELGDD